jgi:SH3-like domain-containing protein
VRILEIRVMRRVKLGLIATMACAVLPAPLKAATKPPYWASLKSDEVRMRTGPGEQFPASWMYRRAELPVKVIAVYRDTVWRKVQDPDGNTGWINVRLLSVKRTALVTGDIRAMRDRPSETGNILYRAEPGVVGKLSECRDGWCKLDVKGRIGYIAIDHIWGDDTEMSRP